MRSLSPSGLFAAAFAAVFGPFPGAILACAAARAFACSLLALFRKARCGAQGVAELGYVSLQYVRFMAAGFCRLSNSVHGDIVRIAAKMGFDARPCTAVRVEAAV